MILLEEFLKEELWGQRKMDEIKSFINAADMLDKIRDNNMTTIDSVCELIDNSLDANARNIWINFDIDKKTKEMWMLIQDDGEGVEKKNLTRALALAGTMNQRYSVKIGRFGMGLSNACASQSPKSLIASKRKGDEKIWTNEIDFEYLKKSKTTDFPPTYELKDDFLLSKIKFKDSGTLVYWNPCDNLDRKNLGTLNSHLLNSISRLYRYFLNSGKKIYLNGKSIEMFDPLCRLENHRFAKEYGLSKIYGEPIIIPVKYYDEDLKKEKTGKVVVEIVLLDYNKIWDNPKFNPKTGENKLDIGMKTQGLYLVRNGREVDNPQWFETARQKEDWKNYIRGEIRFDSNLDWFFGIGHNKNRAFPKDIVLDKLKEKVKPIISTAVSEHKKIVSQRKEDKKREGSRLAKKIHEDATQFFIPDEKLEITDKTIKKRKKKTKEELKEELLQKIDNSPILTERTKKIRKKIVEDMFEGKIKGDIIISNDGASAPIFRTETVNGKRIIMVNGDHKFYEHIYEPVMDNVYANTMIDLAFHSLADVRDGLGDDKFVEIFEQIIARFSRRYGVMFNQKHFIEALSYLESEKEES